MVSAPFRLRDVQPDELPVILRHNNAEVPHVGHLTLAELTDLAREAWRFLAAETPAGEFAGFILALDPKANYASLNFRWFQARYPSFIYIDRILILPAYKGQGIGRLFYDELARLAKPAYPLLTCEVNLIPPNPDSMTFHARIGFREVGQQLLAGGQKKVAMLSRPVI